MTKNDFNYVMGWTPPPYNRNTMCTKCTSTTIENRYEYLGTNKQLHHDDEIKEYFSAEIINRTCKSCGYAWVEACADNETEEEKET